MRHSENVYGAHSESISRNSTELIKFCLTVVNVFRFRADRITIRRLPCTCIGHR